MEFLVLQEKYLEAGVHIGTKTKVGSMRQFIYKAREDGLHVLDLKKLDEHLRSAARLISKYEPEKVYAVGSKDNAIHPVKKFCELTGCQGLIGRFTPGRFTNPARTDFCEPKMVLAVDPSVDRQAVKEAFEVNVPVIALCDTNNSLRYVDLAVPTNNKGRKAIALVFWILAREVLKFRGKIVSNEEFTAVPADFEEAR
ncbi:MAG: 30S ribosomal protein S2 [Candidatus Micrarchaeota archaeon]|nr:30S ribosomal protein S2 [Candidatus Micrarchaeota archaeon]